MAKAERVSQAIIHKTSQLFSQRGWAPYTDVNIELLGSEATYGAHARRHDCREVVMKLAVRHPSKQALVLFAREIAQAATGMAPGLTGIVGGRPTVYPLIRLFSFLVDKTLCEPLIEFEGKRHPAPCLPLPYWPLPQRHLIRQPRKAAPTPACRW